MEKLRAFVKDLRTDIEMTEPDVGKSAKHAEDLRKVAEELGGVLEDTKQYASTALEAARVYKVIVDAIDEALAAAKLANETAHEAKSMVKSFLFFFVARLLYSRINEITNSWCGCPFNFVLCHL